MSIWDKKSSPKVLSYFKLSDSLHNSAAQRSEPRIQGAADTYCESYWSICLRKTHRDLNLSQYFMCSGGYIDDQYNSATELCVIKRDTKRNFRRPSGGEKNEGFALRNAGTYLPRSALSVTLRYEGNLPTYLPWKSPKRALRNLETFP